MRNLIISLVSSLCIFSSCNSSKSTKISNESEDYYPRVIDSLGLNKIYDKTKWLMYCYQCDDTLIFQKKWKDSNKVYFGFLKLNFEGIKIHQEQLEVNFSFIYKEKNTNDDLVRNSAIRGIVFKYGTDSVLYYSMGTDALTYLRDSCPDLQKCRSRFVDPLQPEVTKFINDHKTELDPWFYKMAQKKGILK